MVHRKVCVCVCVSLQVCKENLTDNGLNQLFNTETKSNREIYMLFMCSEASFYTSETNLSFLVWWKNSSHYTDLNNYVFVTLRLHKVLVTLVTSRLCMFGFVVHALHYAGQCTAAYNES